MVPGLYTAGSGARTTALTRSPVPELPDIQIYIEALEERVLGKTLEQIRINSPFVVRSYDPPLKELHGRRVEELRRIGKRIVFGLSDDYFVVVHLMVAGRFKDADRGAKLTRRYGLAAFDFEDRSLLLTEASKKKRASITAVRGEETLAEIDPGGIEVIGCGVEAFGAALRHENHTLKRTMTDPHVFSGIGNAYSDEILHRAQLSPIKWTSRLNDDEVARLYECTQVVLEEWTERFRAERRGDFPTKVTAFRPEMTVHGKYQEPCPVCGAKVQRIVRGGSEVNYCPTCQTGGKLLADRALSRLLRGDWPKTLEELEDRKARLATGQTPAPPQPGKKKAAGGSIADRIAAMNRRPAEAPAQATPKKTAPRKRRGKGPVFVFAHGAGKDSSSDWMRGWAERLGTLGEVYPFDYPYMREGRRRPDRAEKLIAAHREAIAAAKKQYPRRKLVLIGKSMGSRMGCHVMVNDPPTGVLALVCLGYPLVGAGKTKKVRDEVLLALPAATRILFVQGTRDPLCPLGQLEELLPRMAAETELHVVQTGNHSLETTKTWLKQNESSQDEVDASTLAAIDAFLAGA